MKKYFELHLVAAVSLSAPVYAQSDQVEKLDETVIQGGYGDGISNLELSKKRVSDLTGGSSVIDTESWRGSIVKPEDIFQGDPGVFARSAGTGNDTRLSVRGSGIQRRRGSRGLTIFLDGAPLNDADGSFYTRAIDPFNISHIEVFRGGNGLVHGANQLGGAIKIYQKNGQTHPGGEVIAEVGSYDTYRAHVQYGEKVGPWDYFFGYSYAESGGFRDHQDWDSQHVNFSVGYEWSDLSTTRFNFTHSESNALLPSELSRDEFRDDPQQFLSTSDPVIFRDLVTFQIGQVTNWKTQNGEWNFYTNYQYLDFDHIPVLSPGFNRQVDLDTDTIQAGLTGHYDYHFLGLKNRFSTSLSANYGRSEEGGFTTTFGPFGNPFADIEFINTSVNWKAYFENETVWNDKHHFVAGIGYVWSSREREIRTANQTNDTGFDRTFEGFTGKLGYRYDINAESQLFANVSRSFEAAPFSEAETGASGSNDPLDPQEAVTYEVGFRYKNSWLTSELALYRSDVRNEFVSLELVPNVNDLSNEDTTYEGIEAALAADLNEAFGWDSEYKYHFSLSYQYNDFTFDGGVFDGNRVPVVSEHVINARFEIRADTWSTGVTIDWQPEGVYADNENTLEAGGFAVLDWDVEWKLKQNVTLYAGVKNLLDREFVSTVTSNPAVSDFAPTRFINPGDGRSAFLGVKYTW